MHTGRTVKRRASDVAMTLGATLYVMKIESQERTRAKRDKEQRRQRGRGHVVISAVVKLA